MAQGKVAVSSLNTGSGATKEIERAVLFVGVGSANINKIVAINAQTDFADEFGENSELTKQLGAWARNGDELVSGWAIALDDAGNIHAAIDDAMEIGTVSPEIIVVTTPVTGKADVEAYQAKMLDILSRYARRVRVLVAAPGIDNDPATGQTWADYIAALAPLVTGVLADRVAVVPQMHGDELGAVTGRLCKRSVTIADSPMRTQTGAMSLMPTPLDKNGKPLSNATTAALDAIRFSCPQWYPDFAGTFFGDVNMLDAEGGDYQRIEIGRIVDMAARQVRIIGIHQVKNRRLNNSPTGLAFGKSVLGKPLRQMAKSVNIGADKFPGLIDEPKEDSIGLSFSTPTTLNVIMKVKPIDSPSTILVGIQLDSAE